MSSSHEGVFTILDLSNNPSQLPSNLFQSRNTFFNRKQNTPKVQQLLLRQNRLTSLSIYTKAITQFQHHLIELSLRENLFIEFPQEITILKNLTTLSLANNQLEKIQNGTLSQFPNLLWLNISHNKLSELPTDIVCCHHLRGLDIQSNKFTSFPRVIGYLAHLEVLLMQKNKIKCVPPDLIFPPTLTTLNLAFNQLPQIPTTLINNPPESLAYLHLSGNKLHTIPPNFLYKGYKNLISLDLHTCNLTYCTSRFFQRLSQCKQLRRLNLAINKIIKLPSSIGLVTQLQWLNLNDNQLLELPLSMSNLIHLVKLGLVQNRLTTLPPFLFSHMLDLQKLDLRRNQLVYLPPSILALAPRHEVDVHVDLAVPYTVFHTLSNSSSAACPPREPSCLNHHPYGGSLRSLLFFENPTMEHVDGLLFDDAEEDQVQVISIAQAYTLLQTKMLQNTSTAANALQCAIFEQQQPTVSCSHPKFKQPETPAGLLTEIDEDDHQEDETPTHPPHVTIPSLKELSLRRYLSLLSSGDPHPQGGCNTKPIRWDMREEHRQMFLKEVLPSNAVPDLLHQDVMKNAMQCDYCQSWYVKSNYQIGYLTRLCNNRLQVPVRFRICSLECAMDVVTRLYKETTEWHTKQSLAHIDAALALNSQQFWGGATNDPWIREANIAQQQRQEEDTDRRSSSESSSSASSSYASFGALLRNRITRFASSFFFHHDESDSASQDFEEAPNDISSQQRRAHLHVFRDNSQMIPLVYPNLNLGTTAAFRPQQHEETTVPMTSQLVEGRLQNEERALPPLRLATTPTANPAVFSHLPKEALRLERF